MNNLDYITFSLVEIGLLLTVWANLPLCPRSLGTWINQGVSDFFIL
jgi:hypothetical protein